ncbi:MAG TPA: HAMP domain-containing histidine kinase [Candidatus Acutalibacter pullistercoris]|uniref:histidine kinase n=1 Tax=Candidatus Acutalibacter pullistercoris TaxID=2838418 RepID=A0A9D2C0P5_9FIRM|nr:HAMP domain-containing histidine kinase [Candidatus Acutalibacter pullistercoris]
MFVKGIARRWFVNTIGIVFVILVIFIASLSITVQSSVYSGIETSITGRVDELLNWLSVSSGGYVTSEFNAITRDYIENYFQDKDKMEIMALSRTGQVLITSTGFEPDQQPMPDYDLALQSEDGTGNWIGQLNTGEKVMAITRAVRDEDGALVGSIRYVVSLERADQQMAFVVIILVLAGLFILLLLTFSGVYFIRSILVPVKRISASAKQIAQGDFDVRVEKSKDDELGQLCDAVNDMAGELGAAERMKNDFISSVSHELRTPLTAIKGWAETLRLGADQETAEKGMTVIIRESARLSGLVEELLDFSRLQSGRMRLSAARLDILAELDEAVYLFTDRARTERKELTYEENTSLSPVYGDRDRLRQVFVNIIDNALKYTQAGGVITVSSREAMGYVEVTVSDTGCGIPAQHLPNVKKKFYKANQLVRGSGIGLAVADEIVSLHGGTLGIESQEGVGTVVTIRLPNCAWAQAHPDLPLSPEIQKLIQERNQNAHE